MTMTVNDPELEDAQLLAKAIVLSMMAAPDRHRIGDRTSSLLRAALGAPHEVHADDEVKVDAARTSAVLFMLGDIAVSAVTLLAALGVDVSDQLTSPYLMDEVGA